MNKIFTVIICAYNAENRLKRTIESIINQKNYNKLVDKFLLIDNNSTDTTARIMKEFENRIENIGYIFESKQGLSYARLAGVNDTDSEWIIFIDDDNILEDNWLIEAHKYILKNNRVGAFNGSVLPLIEYNMSQKEKQILGVVYAGLACTNLCKGDIDYNLCNHPYKIPFGAGLVIKSCVLKKLSRLGWLKSKGRTGQLLLSGEDTEMCFFVKSQGYNFGYNPIMVMHHLIPRKRLEVNYLVNLYRGFEEYEYMSASNKKLYIFFRIKRFILVFIKYSYKKIILYYKKNNYSKYLSTKLDIERYKVTIKNTLRDRFVKKRVGMK